MKKNLTEEELFSPVGDVFTRNLLKDVLFTDTFIDFIKMHEISPAFRNINAKRKPQLRRQILQVAKKVVIRKEISKTFKSMLKCFRVQLS